MYSGLDQLSNAAYDARAADTLMGMQYAYVPPAGAPPIVRQNAERRQAVDPDSIMYDFRQMRFGRAHDSVVCPPGKKRNPKYRPNRRGKFQGRRPCIKDKGPRVTLRELQDIARDNNVSIFARRKDGKGFTKKPLTIKALKSRLSRRRVPYRAGRRLGPIARFFAPSPPPTYEEAMATGVTSVEEDPYGIDYAAEVPPSEGHAGFGAPKKKKPKKITLKKLQAIARENGVSIFMRRKDGKGFTKKPLTVKALKSRLSRRRVPYQSGPRPGPLRGESFKVFNTPFRPGLSGSSVADEDGDVFYDAMEFGAGHDFVCPPGMKRNKKWRPKSRKHRRKCLKDKGPRVTLSELQDIARGSNVSIFARRKDGKGFTKKPLTLKALKSRLSRAKVPYRAGRRLGPLARPDDRFLPTVFSPGM